MIQRIEFHPMPEDRQAWLGGPDRMHGYINRMFAQASQDRPLDVQCEAMRAAVTAWRSDHSQPDVTIDMATETKQTDNGLWVSVLWRLVPYAASNAASPRGETLEVQTEVRIDG